MKVIHFIDSLRVGGKERQLVELINGLGNKPDIDNFIVSMGKEDFYLGDILDSKIHIIYLIRKFRWDPFIFLRFYRLISKIKPAIIHTNAMLTSFYALPLARLFGIKLINGSIRNAFTNGGIKWWMEKLLLDLSDVRLANSIAGLRSRGYEQSDRNVVIYNGFNFSRIPDPERMKSQNLPFRLSPYDRVVGMVAEFNRWKDYATFISAAKIVTDKKNDVIFLAVGEGETFDECKRAAGSQLRINFTGSRKNIEEIVSFFTIGVLSTFGEGISNSIMEYMALGKPVVATNGGGTNELVIDGETGFLVPPKNPMALAEKIIFLLDNHDRAFSMGERGRERIKNDFSLTLLTEKTIALYARIAKII